MIPHEWEAVFWWALPNLIVPLFAIPIVMIMQWMAARPTSWEAVIADGQVCFYGGVILASGWYDLRELALRPVNTNLNALTKALELQKSIGSMQGWILLVGLLAALAYGVVASDHTGAKMLTRDRCAVVSVAVGLASIGLAIQIHHMVVTS